MDLGILPWLPIRGVCIREYFSLSLSLPVLWMHDSPVECGLLLLHLYGAKFYLHTKEIITNFHHDVYQFHNCSYAHIHVLKTRTGGAIKKMVSLDMVIQRDINTHQNCSRD